MRKENENYMTQKTLPAITAEIVADFEKQCVSIDPENGQPWLIVKWEDFLRAALRKVAEETKKAITPKRAGGGIGPAVIDIPAENFVNGHNVCRREIDANFKTFINQ